MSKAVTREFVQYGLQYPAGAIKWAIGTAKFDADYSIPNNLTDINPSTTGGYYVDLADAKNGGNNLSHLIGQLSQNCTAIGADPAPYIAGCKIVSRKVLLVTTEGEPFGLDTIEVPEVITVNHGDPEPPKDREYTDSTGDIWAWNEAKGGWEIGGNGCYHWHQMAREWFPFTSKTTK